MVPTSSTRWYRWVVPAGGGSPYGEGNHLHHPPGTTRGTGPGTALDRHHETTVSRRPNLAPDGTPWFEHGDRLRPAARAITDHLTTVDDAAITELLPAALAVSDLQPKTVRTLLVELERFGVISRVRSANHHGPSKWRLTQLGRWWITLDRPALSEIADQ